MAFRPGSCGRINSVDVIRKEATIRCHNSLDVSWGGEGARIREQEQ